MTQSSFELMFRDPTAAPQNQNSTLYLLRRDILVCFGKNPNDNTELPMPAVFPGVMCIMAGIDLLAKFMYGDDESKKKSSLRFKEFVKECMKLPEEQEVLYQLRNSLLHSFGLFSKSWGKKPKDYKFSLTSQGGVEMIKSIEKNFYQINIILLHHKFEETIESFREMIRTTEDLQIDFDKMFSRYGSMHAFSNAQ